MRFAETRVAGTYQIDLEPRHDARGFFARTFCVDEYLELGLDPAIAQCSVGHNTSTGTLRGLHYQAEPFQETKVLRCVRGALVAVAADLRPSSASYLEHVTVELTADNRRALYIPKGCATGYQTLEDDTEIMYEISVRHAPGFERGIHHADPTLAISWPLPIAMISDRDASLPMIEPSRVA
jgi:dTDP-4-dehydrorhamnose 3,5-epimerase